QPVPLALLEQPELVIATVDRDGVPATRTERNLVLEAGLEFAPEIQVPENLASLVVTLRGRVQGLARREPVELAAAPGAFGLNRSDAARWTSAPLLGRSQDGWFLDVLGKNGEPKPDRALGVRLVLRDYTDPLDVPLKTDARGRVRLGELPGVDAVEL